MDYNDPEVLRELIYLFTYEHQELDEASLERIPALETIQERMSICQTCEYINTKSMQCDECGCELMSKISTIDDSCPIGKWDIDKKGWFANAFTSAAQQLPKEHQKIFIDAGYFEELEEIVQEDELNEDEDNTEDTDTSE